MSRVSNLFGRMGVPVLQSFLAEGADDPESRVIRWPLGVEADAVAVDGCLFDSSEETGTGAFGVGPIPGDGTVQNDEYGRKVRRSAKLDVPAAVAVDIRDKWWIHGEEWTTKRREASDEHFNTWRLNAVDQAADGHTKRPRLRRPGN